MQQGLVSIGLDVKVGSSALNYVTEIGDLGSKPSTLDATCFKNASKVNVQGVKDAQEFEITYLYDNSDAKSDYRVLKALEKAKTEADVVVTLPDGTEFSSSGTVATYVTGAKVDSLIEAKAIIYLSADWDVTDPASA